MLHLYDRIEHVTLSAEFFLSSYPLALLLKFGDLSRRLSAAQLFIDRMIGRTVLHIGCQVAASRHQPGTRQVQQEFRFCVALLPKAHDKRFHS